MYIKKMLWHCRTTLRWCLPTPCGTTRTESPRWSRWPNVWSSGSRQEDYYCFYLKCSLLILTIFFVFYCRLYLHFSVHHYVCLFICVSVCQFPIIQSLRSLAYGKFTLGILFCFLESQSYCLHRINICDSMKIRRKKILRQWWQNRNN